MTDVAMAVETSIKQVERHLNSIGSEATGAPFTRTLKIADGKLSFEAGFPVRAGKPGKSSGKFFAATIPGGIVAKTIHRGKGEDSEKGYEALHAWMKANSKHPAGAPWEVYVGPEETHIFYPIE